MIYDAGHNNNMSKQKKIQQNYERIEIFWSTFRESVIRIQPYYLSSIQNERSNKSTSMHSVSSINNQSEDIISNTEEIAVPTTMIGNEKEDQAREEITQELSEQEDGINNTTSDIKPIQSKESTNEYETTISRLRDQIAEIKMKLCIVEADRDEKEMTIFQLLKENNEE